MTWAAAKGPGGYCRQSGWITPAPLFGGAGQVLVRLPAQEGRDVEQIVLLAQG